MKIRFLGILVSIFVFAVPVFAQRESAGDARVASISVEESEDGIVITIMGDHPDSCTRTGDITQAIEGDMILVTLDSTRPADAMCATVLTPFETTYTLDTSDLEAGEYTLDVNGITETVTIVADLDAQDAETTESSEIVFECAEPRDDFTLYDDNGVCFLYPEDYSVIAGRSFILVSQPLTDNPILVVEIDVLDADDPLTIEDIQSALSEDVELAIEDLFIGGESAVVVDEGNQREAFVIANNTVFSFTVNPILEDNTGELLWSIVIDTAVFPVEDEE